MTQPSPIPQIQPSLAQMPGIKQWHSLKSFWIFSLSHPTHGGAKGLPSDLSKFPRRERLEKPFVEGTAWEQRATEASDTPKARTALYHLRFTLAAGKRNWLRITYIKQRYWKDTEQLTESKAKTNNQHSRSTGHRDATGISTGNSERVSFGQSVIEWFS